MRDDRIQHVAEMFIARRWAWESDFGDEKTDTVVQWPPVPPRPARTARGTLPPDREVDHEYDLEYEYECD